MKYPTYVRYRTVQNCTVFENAFGRAPWCSQLASNDFSGISVSKEEFVARKPGASERLLWCARLTSPAACKVALFRNESQARSVVNGSMPNLWRQGRGEV